jgi:hypothetical protein
MRLSAWALALPLTLATAGTLHAQLVVVGPGGGFRYGSSIGAYYQGRNFFIGGFLGGFSSGGYMTRSIAITPIVTGPYGPAYYDPLLPPPPPFGLSPASGGVIYDARLPRPILVKPPIDDETAGIDLDLLPPKKKAIEELPPPPKVASEPAELPGGKVVSKPAGAPPAPPKVKDKDDPPPPKKVPAPKPPESPEDQAAALLDEGLAAFKKEEYGLAAHRFRQAAGLDPKLARAHFLLAQAQMALGKFAPAVEAIHAGMDLAKQWPKAKFQPRLDLYTDPAEFNTHLLRLDAAVKASPNSAALLFLLAYQHWFDDNRAAAVPLFRRARLTAPDTAYIDQFLLAAGPAVVAAK